MSDNNNFQIDEYYVDLQKKAQGLSIINQQATRKRPFPGLRPFRTSEAHLFFGREGISRQLLKILFRQSNFLAILGASGSGKSSLVRAGLIPSLHAGKAQQANYHWRIVICRPGNNPMANLAAAFASAQNKDAKSLDELKESTSKILNKLRESSYGILEVLESFEDNYERTLIIIDQFEELFRFSSGDEASNRANRNFVDLLLTASGLEDSPVYVVITMRSEFLGECVKFRNLPERINQGQYLIPRLTSKNVSVAIEGPVAVAGKKITKALVNRLIHDLGDNMDQLPVLQHALMRTYDLAIDKSARNARLTVADYEEIGTMEKALSNHATEIFLGKLGNSSGIGFSRKQRIAKLIFQRLTDETAGLKGGRYPTPLYKLYAIARVKPLRATRAEINEVINAFRNVDNSFLMPPADTPLKDDLVIDISHESLMRNWDLLIGDDGWIHEEFENGKKYRQLQERRREKEIITGGLLDELIEWEETSNISPTWAKRYSAKSDTPQDYEDNLAFLRKCIKLRRNRRRLRQFAVFAGIAIIIIMAILNNKAIEAENRAKTQRILSIFETLKRSNPTLSYNAIDKWSEYSENESKELLEFQEGFNADNSYLKATLPLSYPFISIVSLFGDEISLIEGDSISKWDLRNGILLERIDDTIRQQIRRPLIPRGRRIIRTVYGSKNTYFLMIDRRGENIELIDKEDRTVFQYSPPGRNDVLSVGPDLIGRHVAISNDEKYLFLGAQVFDLNSKRPVLKVYRKDSESYNDQEISILHRFTRVRFSGDNQHIIITYPDGNIEVVNIESKKFVSFRNPEMPIRRFSELPIKSTVFVTDSLHIRGDSLDNYIIANKSDNTIDVWKYTTFQGDLVSESSQVEGVLRVPEATFVGHTAAINSIKISRDGERLISGSDDNLAMIWDIRNGERLSILRGNSFPIKNVHFSKNDDQIFTSDGTSRFSIWERTHPDSMDYRMKISPFEFYHRGFTSASTDYEITASKLYEIDSLVSASELAGNLCHYMLSLPEKNLFPEDITYRDGLKLAIEEVDSLFDSLKIKTEFKTEVSSHFQDVIFDLYHSLQLRRLDLRFMKDPWSENKRKGTLYSEAMNYYLEDTLAQRRAARYATKIMKLMPVLKPSEKDLLPVNLDRLKYFFEKYQARTAIDSVELKRAKRELISLYYNFQLTQKNYAMAFDVSSLMLEIDDDRTSGFWYNRSFFAIFAGEYDAAVEAVAKTKEFEGENDGVNTNLALAYLFKNNWPEAEKIYLEWKDKVFKSSGKLAKEAFIEDLEALEKQGVSHPDFGKVYELMGVEKSKEISK